MKLESLVGLGINDIPNGLGRVTKSVPLQVTAVRTTKRRELREVCNYVNSLQLFEMGDHTGIYTNEVKREQPKFGTVDSDGRWLASNIKESVPCLSEVPFITGSTPTEKGWYYASLYSCLDHSYLRYWDGEGWTYGGSELILGRMVDLATRRLRKVHIGDAVYRRVSHNIKIVWLNMLDKPIPDWLVSATP